MNRKVVWNACYGGFWLSPIAEKMLYERKHPGETIYFYEEVFDGRNKNLLTYQRIEEEDIESSDSIFIHCVSLDFGKELTFERGSIEEKRFNNHDTFGSEIERHDPDLVAIVEELGTERASGRCSKLMVTDIGDQKYHIDEYDGYETVITKLDENFWK